MAQRNLSLPLSFIAVFAVLLALLLVGALPAPSGAQVVDACPENVYPDPTQRDNCRKTATAEAITPSPYPVTGSTATSGTVAQPQPQPTATVTATVTATAVLTVTATVASTVAPTLTATPSRTPTFEVNIGATITPTEVPTDSDAISCVPGESVLITGEARPGTALLVFFNSRPVGGTLARPDGTHAVALRVGDERPGVYPVEVRERDSRALVQEFACAVPGATPTPTSFIVR